MANVIGYNFYLQVGGKKFIGVTQDDMTISAIFKESITKDDAGSKSRSVTGHDVTFKVTGIMKFAESSQATSHVDVDDIMDLVMATGSSAVYTFVYTRSTGDSYTGSCVITGYSESTPADGESDSTYTVDIATSGAMTKVTSGGVG